MKFLLITVSISLFSVFIFSSPVGKSEPLTLTTEYPFKNSFSDTVRQYFETAIKKNRIVGAAVAVVVGDSLWLIDGYGSGDLKGNVKVDGNTVFRIGSLSKGFAAVTAAILVEEGLMNWDDIVAERVPDFKSPSKSHVEQISLSHILSHTSGMPYHSYTNLIEDGLSLPTIAGRFASVKPISKPGKIYSYQNAMFALSELMMERSTELPFREILADRVFYPLDMSTASSDYSSLAASGNLAKPHYRRKGQWISGRINDKYYNAIAAGGINASALDMSKWMKLLLGNHPEIISDESLNKVFTPRVPIKDRNRYYQKWDSFSNSYYAMGWRVHAFEDPLTQKKDTMIHHGGYVSGYRGEIALLSEEKIGICVLFNSPNSFSKNVVPFLLENVRQSIRMHHTWSENQRDGSITQ